jgi:hypothetical protein
MFRFDQLVRPGMIVRDVKQKYPQAAAVFETFGFRSSCDDCSIEEVARKHGMNSREVVDILNEKIREQALD